MGIASELGDKRGSGGAPGWVIAAAIVFHRLVLRHG